MAQTPELPWDFDLDLGLDFDLHEKGFTQTLQPFDIDLNFLKDPLKDFESVGSTESSLKTSSASLPTTVFSPSREELQLVAGREHGRIYLEKSSSLEDIDTVVLPTVPDKKPKRARKPQKDRHAEVEQRVTELQEQLHQGQQQQEQLLLQQAQLESSASSSQSGAEEQGGDVSPDVPNQHSHFYLLDTEGQMQHRKGTEIVNLSVNDSIAIHEIYMERVGRLLAQRQDCQRDAEIVQLAGQVCTATYLKGLYKPESMRETLSFNKLNLTLEQRQRVWTKVLAALKLTCQQQEKLLHFRRLFLPTQRQLLQTRQQLMESLQDTQTKACRTDADLMTQTGACRRLVRQLQQNLHADQSILNRLFAQVFGEVLVGIQKAVILVEFWPCPFDLVGLLNQLAEEAGDTATAILLGLTNAQA